MAYVRLNTQAFTLRLSGMEYAVIGALLHCYNRKTKEAFPSLETIATFVGRDRSHVVRVLRQLEAKHLITKLPALTTGRKSNTYLISENLVPPEIDTETAQSTASKHALADPVKTVVSGEHPVARGEHPVAKRVNIRSKKGEHVVTLTYTRTYILNLLKNLVAKNEGAENEQACPSQVPVEVVAHATASTKNIKPEDITQALPLIAEAEKVTTPKRTKPKAAPPSADVCRLVSEMRKILSERMPQERPSAKWQAQNMAIARRLLEAQRKPLGEVLERMERCHHATRNIPNFFTDLSSIANRWEKWGPGRNEVKTRPGYQGKLEDVKPKWAFGRIDKVEPLAPEDSRSFAWNQVAQPDTQFSQLAGAA